MFIATDPTTSAVATQITVNGIVVAAIELMKRSRYFPWISSETTKINRIISVIGAAIAAIGIHVAWNHGSVPGAYMITVTGLTLSGIGSGIFDFCKSLVFQQIIFKTTVSAAAPVGVTVHSAGPSTIDVEKPANVVVDKKP